MVEDSGNTHPLHEVKGKAMTEEELPSKKAKWSRDEHQSLDLVVGVVSELTAEKSYFGKLLEAPIELPNSVKELQEFLSQTTVPLPLVNTNTYHHVEQPGLVTNSTSAAEREMASHVESLLQDPWNWELNEATTSVDLWKLTIMFLQFLNSRAPVDNKLLMFETELDSLETISESGVLAVKSLKRPNCLVYVCGALILRWESKAAAREVALAQEEIASKLKVWSPV